MRRALIKAGQKQDTNEARPFITEAREKIDNDMVKGVADAAAEETEFRISEIINFVNKSK